MKILKTFYPSNILLFISIIWFFRVILFPIFLLIQTHKLIVYPFRNKYFFKKIETFTVITTGGTGGHLFPAIRLASYITLKGKHVRIVTSQNSLTLLNTLGYLHKKHFFYTEEANECPNGIKVVSLKIQPLRKNINSTLAFVYAMLHSLYFFVTRGALIENIIGLGGYASFPMIFWGCIFNKKIYIHEQNTIFGKVNKLFAPFAHNIFSTLPINQNPHPKKTINTGMPLQKSVEQRGFIKQIPQDDIKFLVISGSSGGSEEAHSIISAIINFAKKYKEGKITVLHQASEEKSQDLREIYTKHNISSIIKPFFHDIHKILPTIDLCISRSGAGSIVDLLSCGIPTIFIPLKYSADKHQLKNAAWVVQNKLGFMHKSWESNFYNLTALMYFALTFSNRLSLNRNGQLAIKRNARSSIYNYIF